uniref:Uncharacterized protein n=1 Tax=Amazona collaria TaxID=241587 RepID=A0A8B9G0R0_9PSIT
MGINKIQNPNRNNCVLVFTGFAKPTGLFMRCGYRGTFCYPKRCPPGNIYLGVCRLGHSCCRW